MGFLKSVKAQVRPLEHNVDLDVSSGFDKSKSDPPSETRQLSLYRRAHLDTIVPTTSSQAPELSLYRNEALGAGLEAGGIAKVEGAKAVWGKNGRYLIIAR